MDVRKFLLKIYKILYGSYGPQGWWPAESWFEVIVGAVLTQNTSWNNVEKAIHNIRKAGALDPVILFRLRNDQLSQLIKSAGFYNLKTVRLKNLLSLLSEYNFDFHSLSRNITREILLNVNGIGKETADSILLYAFDKPVFVVDNYTKRVFERLGILNEEDSYDKIQAIFHDLPKDTGLYKEYHALIVKHAKDICLKNKPKCNICCVKGFCAFHTHISKPISTC
ncbi:endonuclease III domain-containing protein [Pseudothermotoga sp.]|uniref:endonuclease III domain-containing protein n=1 Tax=Pseudothermotoga sp. TaxID=2033661 RepID=UPI00258AB4F8|nr:endonuclease III domain-containing protein [Pseudothermotoga sp.]MDK2884890.1 endonuclease related protein [Pseudothermotoga sp.]